MNGQEDRDLLERWRVHRDGDAFAEIARRHSGVVFDLTCRVLGDRSQAEDILQEALLDLALDRTGRPADVGVIAWLVRFAICRARNRRSSERSRARRQTVVGLERPEAAMPDEAVDLKDELEHALRGADPEDRALLAMRFLHGWDYERIASALSLQEGAVRVRVHRALHSVRSRLPAAKAERVAPALAALPVATIAPGAIDRSVRTVVELARVRLGAPPNGVEQATAASRSFQAAVACSGAALLLVTASGVLAVSEPPGRDGRGAAADVASVLDRRDGTDLLAESAASGPAEVAVAFRAFPRPHDWHAGVLGGPEDVAIDGPAPRETPARTESAASPAARPSDGAPARECERPAAPAVADGGPETLEDEPSALRPKVRGACAAKGDPFSSEDERAGALGGSEAVADEEPPETAPRPARAEPARGAGNQTSARSRAMGVVRVATEALPAETLALVEEAQGLLREYIDAAASDETAAADEAADSADVADAADAAESDETDGASEAGEVAPGAKARGADRRTVRQRIRQVRRNFDRLSRTGSHFAAAPGASVRAKRARAQAVRRVLGLLTRVVLTDGRLTGDLRWPAGADVAFALEEVIRVLGGRLQGDAGDAPSVVVPEGDSQVRLPSGFTGAGGDE